MKFHVRLFLAALKALLVKDASTKRQTLHRVRTKTNKNVRNTWELFIAKEI